MTKDEALKLALDKKADNARELGLDYEPENTLHWHALNYRTAPTQNAQAMFKALEKFVEAAIKEALAQPDPVATVESVATVVSESGNQEVTMSWWHEPALPVGTKLYTTPPQRTWVGLTVDEIEELQEQPFSQNDWCWFYTKAVETKLKQKNGYTKEQL